MKTHEAEENYMTPIQAGKKRNTEDGDISPKYCVSKTDLLELLETTLENKFGKFLEPLRGDINSLKIQLQSKQ
jgi:hypothetical protein